MIFFFNYLRDLIMYDDEYGWSQFKTFCCIHDEILHLHVHCIYTPFHCCPCALLACLCVGILLL